MLHAFIRQESKFNVGVESHTGAVGLMQIMPATATYVAGGRDYSGPGGRMALSDPRTNLMIGQKYIGQLLNHRAVDNNLFALTIAYNAGPGNLSRWQRERQDITDPLLFIETIPYAETRAFVERVMSNYWIYSLQMGQPTPSLDAVAEGRWPIYTAMDAKSPKSLKLAGK